MPLTYGNLPRRTILSSDLAADALADFSEEHEPHVDLRGAATRAARAAASVSAQDTRRARNSSLNSDAGGGGGAGNDDEVMAAVSLAAAPRDIDETTTVEQTLTI